MLLAADFAISGLWLQLEWATALLCMRTNCIATLPQHGEDKKYVRSTTHGLFVSTSAEPNKIREILEKRTLDVTTLH